MSQLTVTVLQLGLLALLWLFVVSVVGVLRRDLYGTRVVARPPSSSAAPGAHRSAAPANHLTPSAPAPAVPAAAAAPPAPHQPPAGATPPRRLVVTEGPLTGTTIELGRSPVLIGRAPECTLVLADDYASSRHARLVPQGEGWAVEDLGSTNGTTVSRSARAAAEPVKGSVPVAPGSVVRIGRTALELQR